MKDLIITICRDTRKVKLNRGFIGLNGENLQGNIIVDFTDKAEFVDGTAYFEVVQNGKPYSLPMAKDGENKAYKLPIKSSLLAYACELGCQVVIRQEETADGIPVFKSEEFKLPCHKAINATETIPEQYPSWVKETNERIFKLEREHKQWLGTIEGDDPDENLIIVDGDVTVENVRDGDEIYILDEPNFITVTVRTAEYNDDVDKTFISLYGGYDTNKVKVGKEVYSYKSMGSQGVGGTKLYKHDLWLTFESAFGNLTGAITVISTISSPFTIEMTQDRENLGIVSVFGRVDHRGAGVVFSFINISTGELLGWDDSEPYMTTYAISTIDSDTVTEL